MLPRGYSKEEYWPKHEQEKAKAEFLATATPDTPKPAWWGDLDSEREGSDVYGKKRRPTGPPATLGGRGGSRAGRGGGGRGSGSRGPGPSSSKKTAPKSNARPASKTPGGCPPRRGPPRYGMEPVPKPPPPPPKEEEPSSIFASLGKTVMNFTGLATDDQTVNTTGSVKYPGASTLPVKAKANAAKAQDTANEMAEELNKLMNPDAADISAPSGKDDFDWRADDSDHGVDVDDFSIFSNQTEMKVSSDGVDLMTLIQAQMEKKKENAVEEDSKKSSSLATSTKKAQLKAKKMGTSLEKLMSEYAGSSDDSARNLDLDVDLDFKKDFEWFAANHATYVPPTDEAFDEEKKKTMRVQRALDRTSKGKGELDAEKAEKTALMMQEESSKWATNAHSYNDTVAEFEAVQAKFVKLRSFLGDWMAKGLPQPEWQKFNPCANVDEAVRRAKDLQGCLGLLSEGHFDPAAPHYNPVALNRIKDLFVDIKLKQNNDAGELEDALRWWRLNAATFNPFEAADEEDETFRRAKGVLATFGLKAGDKMDARNKYMQEALLLWAEHKNDESWDDLEEYEIEQLTKVKQALLQLKRESLGAKEMQRMGAQMNDLMSWYISEGRNISDPMLATDSDRSTFTQAKEFLTLWGRNASTPERVLGEACGTLVAMKSFGYTPDIFDMPDDPET
ncbi:MAG: hypothetical protein SGILL_003721, partial [Bacillariaceae sp.]